MERHDGKQWDRPRLRERLADWLRQWGADAMLAAGSLLVSAGVGWIFPPAGLWQPLRSPVFWPAIFS